MNNKREHDVGRGYIVIKKSLPQLSYHIILRDAAQFAPKTMYTKDFCQSSGKLFVKPSSVQLGVDMIA